MNMDVQEFQKKLTEICAVAAKKEHTLDVGEVRDFFAGMELNQTQMIKVLQFLKMQGITVQGAEIRNGPSGKAGETSERKTVPLTAEEKVYYREYQEGLNRKTVQTESVPELFEALSHGDIPAREKLAEYYLGKAAEIAVSCNTEEIYVADLIQEANVCLLTALDHAGTVLRDEEWLLGEIRRGIDQVLLEQTKRKLGDDSLVAKVEKLESAIRELTEDEENGESQFSIGELAVILDMDVEEMKDILRLTGDDR